MAKEKEMVFLGVKVPKELYDMLAEEVRKDTHTSISEFVREAIRMMLRQRGRKI